MGIVELRASGVISQRVGVMAHTLIELDGDIGG